MRNGTLITAEQLNAARAIAGTGNHGPGVAVKRNVTGGRIS